MHMVTDSDCMLYLDLGTWITIEEDVDYFLKSSFEFYVWTLFNICYKINWSPASATLFLYTLKLISCHTRGAQKTHGSAPALGGTCRWETSLKIF